ncbi:uncharacterized protein TNCV_1938431 [Trichonephila clavipes]|nr:uncharacterized protein TNCV_1938431 [Trichonephila clavipes]
MYAAQQKKRLRTPGLKIQTSSMTFFYSCISMSSSTAACYSGAKCFNQTDKNKEVSTAISVVVQNGDEIQIMIDIEETNDNYTTRLVVLSKQESSLKCDFENQKIVMTSEAKNVTLEDAILHPGEINLFGK